jgi:hypothetical protein
MFDPQRTYGKARIANVPGRPLGMFGHFVVINHGRRVAKGCRSRLVALSRIEGEGEVPIREFRAQRTLKWANEPEDALLQDIEPGREGARLSDLCYTIQDSPLLYFFVVQQPASGVQTVFPQGRYRATVRVDSEDGSASARARLEISFDGPWEGMTISQLP